MCQIPMDEAKLKFAVLTISTIMKYPPQPLHLQGVCPQIETKQLTISRDYGNVLAHNHNQQ